jgi:TPR repeat protein
MGMLYEQGISVDQNLELAFKCFFKAAELGCIKSNTKVAHMYYSGVKAHKFEFLEDEDLHVYMATDASISDVNEIRFVLRPDKMEALRRYLKSAKKGDTEACNCAGLILESINPIEAVDCYRQALELDERNTDAMLNLALLYYTSKEERDQHVEALKLIQRASDLGNNKAKIYLEQRGMLGLYHADQERTNTPLLAAAIHSRMKDQLIPSIKKEVTLQWDLTKTHVEPIIQDESDMSYQYT